VVRGHDGVGITAPDLTHIGSRTTIAAGLLENNTEQLRRWIRDPGSVKPGNKMTLAYARKGQDGKPIDGIKLTTEEEVALAAYLESLNPPTLPRRSKLRRSRSCSPTRPPRRA
jgi:cytochrome c oxidase subunit 2